MHGYMVCVIFIRLQSSVTGGDLSSEGSSKRNSQDGGSSRTSTSYLVQIVQFFPSIPSLFPKVILSHYYLILYVSLMSELHVLSQYILGNLTDIMYKC